MWQADEKDDVADPATWRKACPNLGVTVDEGEYRRERYCLPPPVILPAARLSKSG